MQLGGPDPANSYSLWTTSRALHSGQHSQKPLKRRRRKPHDVSLTFGVDVMLIHQHPNGSSRHCQLAIQDCCDSSTTSSPRLRYTPILCIRESTKGRCCAPSAIRAHPTSPEAVLVLRSISIFETLYLSRSTTRMTEPVNAALTSYLSARGNPPGAAEGVQIARAVSNELDSAKFDPLLVRTVARNAVKVLDNLITKIDGAVSLPSDPRSAH